MAADYGRNLLNPTPIKAHRSSFWGLQDFVAAYYFRVETSSVGFFFLYDLSQHNPMWLQTRKSGGGKVPS